VHTDEDVRCGTQESHKDTVIAHLIWHPQIRASARGQIRTGRHWPVRASDPERASAQDMRQVSHAYDTSRKINGKSPTLGACDDGAATLCGFAVKVDAGGGRGI
jgi:hypothetical protein